MKKPAVNMLSLPKFKECFFTTYNGRKVCSQNLKLGAEEKTLRVKIQSIRLNLIGVQISDDIKNSRTPHSP